MCGRCIEIYPLDAITLFEEEGIIIDREVCTSCGQCVETCLNQALNLVGKYMTVEELFQEVIKDSPFYRRSNGGITVGGGEPTMQHEFITAFLKRCKQSYIHTAIETCGYVKWEYLEKLLSYVDLIYFDIKHMDTLAHKELTGVSSELILKNARKASVIRPIIIRIPLVLGCNDSDDNILNTAKFAFKLGDNLKRIELLPYHIFGTQIYGQLDRDYKLINVKPPSDDHMIRLKKIVESCGVKAQIGG
ncbi:MAG: glycyl-radical enzyme activating protein [Candidatus Hodarchaeota archaeon]